MLKWLALIFIIIITAGFSFFRKPNPPVTKPETNNAATTSPNTLPPDTLDYQFNNSTFRVSWYIANSKNLTLIPNYSEKKTSSEVKEANHCARITNAGFYNKDGSPIGLVVNNGETINNFQQNYLFNGFFSVDDNGKPTISPDIPQNPRLAIQSGPILISGKQIVNLNIQDDESARRSVAAITNDGKLIFLSFYKSDSVYEGPLLGDLSVHLQKFEKLNNITISDALNLDGGSASVFISDGINLGELTNVGSFLCAKNSL